jgi:hypothetical protein
MSEVGCEILRYLTGHPDASDTFEGIVQWWLLERRIERRMTETKKGLQMLVAKGLVLETRAADSRMHYRLNPEKQKEILALVKQ